MVAKPNSAYFPAADLGPPRSKRHQAWRQPSGAIANEAQVTFTNLGKWEGAWLGYFKLGWMPLASLRCHSARFDDEKLNEKGLNCYLKN